MKLGAFSPRIWAAVRVDRTGDSWRYEMLGMRSKILHNRETDRRYCAYTRVKVATSYQLHKEIDPCLIAS